jgi:predicted kinase
MKKQPALILVLGMPGSGKTTLATRLSKELTLPLISKDDIKVMLFDVYGWKDREWSKMAGQASYEIMDYFIIEQLRVGNSIIVESPHISKSIPIKPLP